MSRDWLCLGVVVLACACAAETSEAPEDTSNTPSGGSSSGGKKSGSSGSGSLAGTKSDGAGPSDEPSEGGAPSTEDGGSSSGGTSTSQGGKTSGGAGKPNTGGGGSGGAPPASGTGWKFPTNTETWAASYAEPGALMGSSSVSWDSGVGSPDNGSLKLTIPFSGTDQKLDVAVAVAGMNFTGKTLTAKVKLDSGLTSSPDTPGGAKLYVKTGNDFIYADSGWTNLDGNWASVTLNVSSPAGYKAPGNYNAGDVREVGVEIATGSTGSYSSAVLHIDTVVY